MNFMNKIVISVFCILTAIFLFGCEKQNAPIQAFNDFNKSVNAKDWQKVWSMLSSKSQKAFASEGYKRMCELIEAMPPEIRKKKVDSLNVTNDELLKMSPEQFFIYVMKQTEESQDFFKVPLSVEIANSEVKDDKAVLYVKGKNEYVLMVKENGEWKMEFEEE